MSWTPERIAEMKLWQKQNKASSKQTADHFKISKNQLAYALYVKGKKVKAQVPKKNKVKVKKPFIDIQTVTTLPEVQSVALIMVPMNQLKNVVGALWA